jgi:hypothetical protein
MNSFTLSCLFTSLSNHSTLRSLNLFNNSGITNDVMKDLRESIMLGNIRL